MLHGNISELTDVNNTSSFRKCGYFKVQLNSCQFGAGDFPVVLPKHLWGVLKFLYAGTKPEQRKGGGQQNPVREYESSDIYYKKEFLKTLSESDL